jgi:hypothetical protein
MDEQIELASERLPHFTEDPRDVLVRAHVALRHKRRVDRCGQLAHRRLDPLALVREGKARAARGERAGDRPGDRAAVGDAEDESPLTLEGSGHPRDPRAIACST